MVRMKKDAPVSLQTAKHVLWYFGDRGLGEEPGGFMRRQIDAIAHADQGNREKLTAAFPEHVAAVQAAQHEVWGVDWLRGIVKAALDAADDIARAELSWLDRMDGLGR
jgi:hypothetical protein